VVDPRRRLNVDSTGYAQVIRFYEGSGSSEIQLLDDRFSAADWQRLKAQASEFLSRQGKFPAAEFLDRGDFMLKTATNGFGDEFCVLHQSLSMDQYVEALDLTADIQTRADAENSAKAVGEITGEYVRFVAVELRSDDTPTSVPLPLLEVSSEIVERALNDAERLISSQGSPSAVDRVHTAFHGYLRALADRTGVEYPSTAGVTEMYKLLRTEHPAFTEPGPNQASIDKIMRALSSVVDALNPLRNHSSVAHANDEILRDPEAMLVVNSVRTLLHYLNARTKF
jgi:Abortive infection C-terminus/HEPN domain